MTPENKHTTIQNIMQEKHRDGDHVLKTHAKSTAIQRYLLNNMQKHITDERKRICNLKR